MTRGEFTRLDPESCIAGEAGWKEGERWGGRIWSGQIFRHLFFFTDWLAVKVIMIITQGQVRYTGRQSTLYLSLFFFTVQDGQG